MNTSFDVNCVTPSFTVYAKLIIQSWNKKTDNIDKICSNLFSTLFLTIFQSDTVDTRFLLTSGKFAAVFAEK